MRIVLTGATGYILSYATDEAGSYSTIDIASGTATKTLSTGFGTLEEQGDAAQIEIRASWTPLGDGFATHAEAWSELLCLLAGLPHQEGVASLGTRRARRGG